MSLIERVWFTLNIIENLMNEIECLQWVPPFRFSSISHFS
eukprot:COSAG06_NODE_41714_length_388_cov_1.200692_1_plen_39_part_10